MTLATDPEGTRLARWGEHPLDVLEVAASRIGRVLQDDSSPEAGAYYRSNHRGHAQSERRQMR